MYPAPSIYIVRFALFLLCILMQASSACSEEAHHSLEAVDSSPLEATELFGYVGNGSCAYCHSEGEETQASTKGREYKIWVNDDPHSDAYATLLTPESRLIARNLGLPSAHKAQVCLDCHATDAREDGGKFRLATSHRHSLADGVGCESCHGPAEQWLEPHTRPEWKFLTFDQKKVFGFDDTADLVTRGKICADCHIGSLDKDMNHDLIASGHPRLLFELSAHQAIMPRHWSRNEDLATNTQALEARLWSVGQITSMLKKVELLQRRASSDKAPWPELSEYGCYECHHDLRARTPEVNEPFSSGKPVWATWHRPMFELVMGMQSSNLSGGSLAMSQVANLEKEMMVALPDRKKVILLTEELRVELEASARRMADRDWSEPTLRRTLYELTSVNPDDRSSNWDGLTQRYLGAVSIRHALIDIRGGQYLMPGAETEFSWKNASRKKLTSIRDQLYFESDFDSPRAFGKKQKEHIASSFLDLGRSINYGSAPVGGVPILIVRE